MGIRHFITVLSAAAAYTLSAFAASADYNVIPLPNDISIREGKPFVLTSGVHIEAPASLDNEKNFLISGLKNLPTEKSSGNIVLSTSLKADSPEAYRLTVTDKKITIDGASPAGVFYGVQTLLKSLAADRTAAVTLQPVVINDSPRFAYRGAHFDVVRHFFTLDEVRTFIDMLALHNINVFHWHLTDDQGWRVEIKKYPRLTEVGSKRPGTLVGRYGASETIDSVPVEGFYTQDEIRDIVRYAADRHIEIIPEIDLPSHMMAALASYPELGCTGGPYEVLCSWAGYKDVLCPGKDKTMQFIKDVLNEVMALFPSKYIHIGGDECPKDRWKECPDCQARIKELGITATDKASAEDLLQGYFTRFASDVAAKAGKTIIGWDEILESDIPDNAVVMSWRGVDGAIEGTRRNHPVILSPHTFLYFDYYQGNDMDVEPLAIGGYSPIRHVYSFEPIDQSMTEDQSKLVLGAQANLWTEYVPTFAHAQYMELPRMAALAEIQWTQPEKKDFENFKQRLPHLISIYDERGYNYARHIMDTHVSYRPDRERRALEVTCSVYPGYHVRYTLDGTEPTIDSPVYTDPLYLSKDCVIKLASFSPKGEHGTLVSDTLRIGASTFGDIVLANAPYAPSAFDRENAFVDGVNGNGDWRCGRWVGFLGDDCDATITLPEEKTISKVDFNTCIVWPEGALEYSKAAVYTSPDGKEFSLAATVENPQQDPAQKNGAYNHTISFDPVKAKAVRVVITPCAPSGQWKRILFVDEIRAY